MYMLNNGGAMANCTAPDVCKTPSPGGPVPTPYPNIADTSMTDPGGLVNDVLVAGMPALNNKSQITLSNGDQAGVAGGVTSGKIMGPAVVDTFSKSVQVRGKPAVFVTCQTSHNDSNTVGLFSAPSQTMVLVLQ